MLLFKKSRTGLKDCSQLLNIRSSWTFTDSILLDALYIHQARKLTIDSKIIAIASSWWSFISSKLSAGHFKILVLDSLYNVLLLKGSDKLTLLLKDLSN
ncbi:hypothetical protein R3W88_030985 [Solanum pinnatisectum]|uniref:Uncharacterized protein n=1 Tax=Solanum pinnatisectum TaxID=50273 RepID=A0AAV9LKK5_9SOLN|nr:hypothetical protein R3W88_030985 [Solanum pinnatisectum]